MQTVEEPQSAQSVYRFSNSAQGGLGDQLPAGIVRFYIRDKQGAPQFIGENQIGHTPMGSELSLATGDAFDVKVKSVVERRESRGLFRWKTSMRYTLSNALPRGSPPIARNGMSPCPLTARPTSPRLSIPNTEPVRCAFGSSHPACACSP